MDPLTGAICDTEEISQMVDEMLIAQAEWLPQYKKVLPAAKARLREAKQKGYYKGTKKWEGAARITPRSNIDSDWASQAKAKIFPECLTSTILPATDINKFQINNDIKTTIQLKPCSEGGQRGFFDIRKIHEGKNGIVLIKFTTISKNNRKGKLVLGPDGPFKVWVNGRKIAVYPEATNPAIGGQYKIPVSWSRGKNIIHIAISSNNGNAWGLYAGLI